MSKTTAQNIQPLVAATVTVRELTQEDLPALEWGGEYLHFRKLYLGVYQRIQKGTAKAWIAESPAAGIIGQVFLQMDCERIELADGWNRAYLYSFRIKPEFRNLGIGTSMLIVLENYLISRKFSRLTLNVTRENSDAIRMYQRHGFTIVAEEPGIWSYQDHLDKWQTVEEPSWRMEKLLIPPVIPKGS